MKILVTGAAGFIGYHLCELLLKRGHSVVGLDNINSYYSVELKYSRLRQLGIPEKEAEKFNLKCTGNMHGSQYVFVRMNLEDREQLPQLFQDENFDVVCNLAAQAGVRYSLENAESYIDSNIVGFLNVLECCRHHKIKHLVYASSSSVYGLNDSIPFSINDKVDQPISLYAASKKSNELMAHTYSHLFGLPTTGLRLFTVYGPWGRPDMAIYLFTKAIFENQPIKVFNDGNMERDFTFISDVVEGILKVIEKPIASATNYRLYNIGNSAPVKLVTFISEIENCLDKKAKKILLPNQPGDVTRTWANIEELEKDYDYKPNTAIKKGVRKFVDWFVKYESKT